MIVALPFCAKDLKAVHALLEWIGDLGGAKAHTLWLIMDAAVDWTAAMEVVQAAAPVFGTVHSHSTPFSVSGWPQGPNALFFTAAYRLQGHPFLWLEPDAIPLCPEWLGKIEAEYKQAGKPFMGCMYDCDMPGLPKRLMSGVAVYPLDAMFRLRHLSNCTRAWDVEMAPIAVANGHPAMTIQHFWGWKHPNNAPTFVETRPTSDAAHLFTLSRLNSGAVLFHRNKDGTLIQLLRKRGKLKKQFKRLDLKAVSMWGCIWSNDPELTLRFLRVMGYCHRLADFGDTILFSAAIPQKVNFPCRLLRLRLSDVGQFNRFVNEVVPRQIYTDFAMAVHEDGFILNPELWKDEFLTYDYIGAPWPDGVVGNGGFSIESRKMIQAKLKLPKQSAPIINADLWICRAQRQKLEQQGIRFAPLDIAEAFSTELTGHDRDSFGFHGRHYNVRRYQEGWRQIEASEQ